MCLWLFQSCDVMAAASLSRPAGTQTTEKSQLILKGNFFPFFFWSPHLLSGTQRQILERHVFWHAMTIKYLFIYLSIYQSKMKIKKGNFLKLQCKHFCAFFNFKNCIKMSKSIMLSFCFFILLFPHSSQHDVSFAYLSIHHENILSVWCTNLWNLFFFLFLATSFLPSFENKGSTWHLTVYIVLVSFAVITDGQKAILIILFSNCLHRYHASDLVQTGCVTDSYNLYNGKGIRTNQTQIRLCQLNVHLCMLYFDCWLFLCDLRHTLCCVVNTTYHCLTESHWKPWCWSLITYLWFIFLNFFINLYQW